MPSTLQGTEPELSIDVYLKERGWMERGWMDGGERGGGERGWREERVGEWMEEGGVEREVTGAREECVGEGGWMEGGIVGGGRD